MWRFGVRLPHAKNYQKTRKRPLSLCLAPTEGAWPDSHPTPWSLTYPTSYPIPHLGLTTSRTRRQEMQYGSPVYSPPLTFQRHWPPNPQSPNIMYCANVCSKCTDVPINKTGNPFCVLQKQSSVKREKGHTGDNLSNTKQHVLSLLHWCHWNSGRLTGRKLRLMPANTSCCGHKVYSLPGRENRSTQSFYLLWFVWAVLLKLSGASASTENLIRANNLLLERYTWPQHLHTGSRVWAGPAWGAVRWATAQGLGLVKYPAITVLKLFIFK